MKTTQEKVTNNKKGGCLKSCLIALAVIMLSAIAWIPLLIYIVVKKKNNEKVPAWSYVFTVLSALIMIGSCSGESPDPNQSLIETSSSAISIEESSTTEINESMTESIFVETTEEIEESCSEETTEESSPIETTESIQETSAVQTTEEIEETLPVETTVEPTTEEPTTVAPTTTIAPTTTQAPTTTAAPTTVAPTTQAPVTTTYTYVLNTNTKKFHRPDCRHVKTIHAENREDSSLSRESIINMEYTPCGTCKP